MGEAGRGVGGANPFMGALMLLCYSLFTAVLLIAVTASASVNTLPGCPATCGNVSIPYPFGIDPNCSFPGFELSCNDIGNGVYKPFFGNVEFINISLQAAQARIYNYISWQCYNATYANVSSNTWRLNFTDNPFRFSDIDNKFTVVGCDTLAYIGGRSQKEISYTSGCVSVCHSRESLTNGSCSGIGCCQTSIPKGINYYDVAFDSKFKNSRVWNFNPCSFAVLTEVERLNFSTAYITTRELNETNGGRAPVVLDWAIGNQTCEVAKRNTTSYACLSKHSKCSDSTNGPGYLCCCSGGYQGNPYLPNGCQDINECDLKEEYPCYGICNNTDGGYNCTCPTGTMGEPKNGTCNPDHSNLSTSVKLVIGIVSSTSLALLLLLSIVVYMVHERRKLTGIKEEYFRRHGGRLLLEEIKSKQGLEFNVFTKEEMEQATNNFDKNRILGGGGHGTVYRGILNDSRVVAIKKSKIIDDHQKKEFGKEMVILSQINHKNVVKLLGCCLEVEVPMLVYEFISNGTLFQLIHNRSSGSNISLDIRLQIALQSAEALAYLHSSASPPILHGDVKSSNILLDHTYNAKVSDFGASMLVPKDETQFATLVQGTCGYLDPEYLQTCQLTDKSDVYSFGVVLLELLTGRKAVYFEGFDEERSLSSCFLSAMKENRLLQLLDNQIINEDMELIQDIAELARRCLNVRGEDRPKMKEVADELDQLKKFKQHPFLQHNPEEIESLLSEPSSYNENESSRYYSIDNKAALNIECGR